MQMLYPVIARIVASLAFVWAAVSLANAIGTEPDAHKFLNMESEGVWTSLPTRVDPESQTFQRLPTPPDPFPLKLRAGSTFKVLSSASFQIDGVDYKLVGAPALERNKVCVNSEGRKFACGLKAFKALDNALRGRSFECAFEGNVADRRLAQCNVNGHEVLSLL